MPQDKADFSAAPKDQVEHYEKLLVEAEQAYATRSQELRTSISEQEQKLMRLQQTVKDYEQAQEAVRQKDEKRQQELTKREQDLKAGWRALSQEKLDFQTEKDEFYKTRSLQV